MVRFEFPRSRLIEQAEQAMESVHDRGVLHGKVRWENILFNPETSDVMVIDFERAGLLDKSRSAEQDAGVLKTPRRTIEQLRRGERNGVVFANFEKTNNVRSVRFHFESLTANGSRACYDSEAILRKRMAAERYRSHFRGGTDAVWEAVAKNAATQARRVRITAVRTWLLVKMQELKEIVMID
ncbi:hypothetical protein E4U60_007338 [Claviceps pazoutovae]|uniref:Protein kinase domain-containing protein n=1 Tax=Claviceps pazoutovae TaxID=1649127 RepID=A0A9P7SI39_9HYPO|nr:hypothetical protein E4U60_007338 [Claviceps pazoutovae]